MGHLAAHQERLEETHVRAPQLRIDASGDHNPRILERVENLEKKDPHGCGAVVLVRESRRDLQLREAELGAVIGERAGRVQAAGLEPHRGHLQGPHARRLDGVDELVDRWKAPGAETLRGRENGEIEQD